MGKNKKQKLKVDLVNKLSTLAKDLLDINQAAQINALRNVNIELIKRNWLFGKRLDEETLTNRSNDYGKQLIHKLSIQLSKYGKGFNQANLYRYLNFYRLYPNIFSTLSIKSKDYSNSNTFLPWSHYVLLMQISNQKERDWYEQEALNNFWSYRQLERNIKTDYYHRIISHQIEDKSNQIITIKPNDFLKSLYILNFVNFKKNQKFKESDLEKALLSNLKDLILELGKGYSLVGNQVLLRSDNQDYYVDLLFYNSIMKRNVLIDLKVGKISHKDIGQMELYLKLFDDKVKQKDDNPSIGIILSSDTNYDVVKYLTLETDNHVVSAKYMTYLPSKDELLNEIRKCKMIVNE